MDIEYYIVFACSVSYLTELILLGILVGTNLFIQDKLITPFRRACAAAMFLDALAILISYFLGWDRNITDYEGGLINAMDGLILWAVLAAGVRLISNLRNPRRLIMLLGAPFLCILLFNVCFIEHGLWQGQIAVLVVGCIEIIYLISRFLRHDIELKQQKSNIENITASWFGVFALIVLAELLFWFVSHYTNETFTWLRVVYYLFVQCCYLVMTFFAIRQKTTTMEDLTETHDNTTQTQQSRSSMTKELEELIKNSKLYLDPDLTLERLAAELHTNQTYVYQCIHDDMGTTFYDYINGQRVEESKHQLINSEETIEGIAIKCGFNSSRTFQRTFKRITGSTPTEWRKANQK